MNRSWLYVVLGCLALLGLNLLCDWRINPDSGFIEMGPPVPLATKLVMIVRFLAVVAGIAVGTFLIYVAWNTWQFHKGILVSLSVRFPFTGILRQSQTADDLEEPKFLRNQRLFRSLCKPRLGQHVDDAVRAAMRANRQAADVDAIRT